MIVGARQRNRLISRAPSNTAPTTSATGNPAPISGAGAAPQPTEHATGLAKANPGPIVIINAVKPLRLVIRSPRLSPIQYVILENVKRIITKLFRS